MERDDESGIIQWSNEQSERFSAVFEDSYTTIPIERFRNEESAFNYTLHARHASRVYNTALVINY